MVKITQSKQPFKPLALEDLAPAVVDVTIQDQSGRVIELPMGVLTWHEWNEIGAEVDEPSKGNPKYWTRINPATKEKEFNPEDVAYVAAKDYAIEQRNYRRLLAALEKGGNDVRRGDTPEEQVDHFIKSVSMTIAGLLVTALTNLSMKGMVSILAQADSFRDGRVQGDGSADLPSDELETE